MGWLWAIIVGFVLGLIAKAIIPGKQHSPLWLTTIFGMLGALAGNAIARGLGVAATPGIDWSRHLFQLVAAIIIVFLGDMAYTATLGKRKQQRSQHT
ncbi:GlsB/YeaQ/YmgE family stress response membrane protein [Streptomyces sp. NPDC093252]|uniref:GlsB/YeaQ/YmgE family stress response membrane protein n=1 Tax=Streptomyces sp. NPDC093252 TaxID=3154980 RepID=UPI003436A856